MILVSEVRLVLRNSVRYFQITEYIGNSGEFSKRFENGTCL